MPTTTWTMDPTHTEIQFKVRHLMITNVTGSFGKFNAELQTEDSNFDTARVKFSAEIDSISTNNEQRDAHLKSADFFDATNHPNLRFVQTGIEKKSDEEYLLTGDLTIRGITKPIKLHAEHGGVITDPWGNVRTGFTVDGKINRKDFGLVWSATTETGGLVVGDDVKLHAAIEFIKQAQ